ncbi:MAG: putative DNA modification/repair radical SAM protein [Gemmatimonadaceae bacterium]
MSAERASRKLVVLADAAKYDASCASDGRAAAAAAGPPGISWAFAGDGRRIALLKILLTNHCIFDCRYCVNRRSSDVERAAFTPDEVVRLTLDYWRRGLIEGLFLSSGVDKSPDDTMEQLVQVVRTLRVTHRWRGYVHLKTIPDASPEWIAEAGRWADRLSVNVELPTEAALARLAPEKRLGQIRRAMHAIRAGIDEARDARREAIATVRTLPPEGDAGPLPPPSPRFPALPRFAPAGQTTQMIVGAGGESDAEILATSSLLYGAHALRRVYYNAYVPIPDAPAGLPDVAPSPLRERRLYQADWLVRHYGFAPAELTTADEPNLELDVDPKLAWALRHRGRFPVDVNRAEPEQLLRVPGLGVRSVQRIVAERRWRTLRVEDLTRLKVPLAHALPFIVAADHNPEALLIDRGNLRERILTKVRQLELF